MVADAVSRVGDRTNGEIEVRSRPDGGRLVVELPSA
jgi:hypothetical protein